MPMNYHAPDDVIMCYTDAEIDLLKRTLEGERKLKRDQKETEEEIAMLTEQVSEAQ